MDSTVICVNWKCENRCILMELLCLTGTTQMQVEAGGSRHTTRTCSIRTGTGRRHGGRHACRWLHQSEVGQVRDCALSGAVKHQLAVNELGVLPHDITSTVNDLAFGEDAIQVALAVHVDGFAFGRPLLDDLHESVSWKIMVRRLLMGRAGLP